MAGQHLGQYGDRVVDRGHPLELVVGQLDAVPLLDLMDQPGQLHRVDPFGAGRSLAESGQPGDDVVPPGRWRGRVHQTCWATRPATSVVNSPTVISANCSDSSSENRTPNRSSTRTDRSASASDSRSTPAGPRVVSSS